jgi:hypothetical protein
MAGRNPVSMTVDGYLYQVSLQSPGVTTATTFTTNDSSGSGGTAIDAPPGQTLLAATLNIANKTDRQEPLPFVGDGTLPNADLFGELDFAVPQSNRATLGIPELGAYNIGCANGDTAAGYCSLGAALMAFSPAQTDFTAPPELAPGSSGTVTILPLGSELNYTVSQSVPPSDVKIYIETTAGCAVTTPPAPGCLTALN